MATLPENWELDYDGARWVYRYKPTGLVQFTFPKEGDEFPQFLDVRASARQLAPEEKLESQAQLKRRATADPTSKQSPMSSRMRATAGPLSPWDGFGDDTSPLFFQSDGLVSLGLGGAYTDVSPVADEDDGDPSHQPEDAKRAKDDGRAPKSNPITVSPPTGKPVELVPTGNIVVSQPGSSNSTPLLSTRRTESRELSPSPAVSQGREGSNEPIDIFVIETGQQSGDTGDAVQHPASGRRGQPLAPPAVAPFDPVGVYAELATEDTAQAPIETNPPPIEMGDNTVLAPIEQYMGGGAGGVPPAELPSMTSPRPRKVTTVPTLPIPRPHPEPGRPLYPFQPSEGDDPLRPPTPLGPPPLGAAALHSTESRKSETAAVAAPPQQQGFKIARKPTNPGTRPSKYAPDAPGTAPVIATVPASSAPTPPSAPAGPLLPGDVTRKRISQTPADVPAVLQPPKPPAVASSPSAAGPRSSGPLGSSPASQHQPPGVPYAATQAPKGVPPLSDVPTSKKRPASMLGAVPSVLKPGRRSHQVTQNPVTLPTIQDQQTAGGPLSIAGPSYVSRPSPINVMNQSSAQPSPSFSQSGGDGDHSQHGSQLATRKPQGTPAGTKTMPVPATQSDNERQHSVPLTAIPHGPTIVASLRPGLGNRETSPEQPHQDPKTTQPTLDDLQSLRQNRDRPQLADRTRPTERPVSTCSPASSSPPLPTNPSSPSNTSEVSPYQTPPAATVQPVRSESSALPEPSPLSASSSSPDPRRRGLQQTPASLTPSTSGISPLESRSRTNSGFPFPRTASIPLVPPNDHSARGAPTNATGSIQSVSSQGTPSPASGSEGVSKPPSVPAKIPAGPLPQGDFKMVKGSSLAQVAGSHLENGNRRHSMPADQMILLMQEQIQEAMPKDQDTKDAPARPAKSPLGGSANDIVLENIATRMGDNLHRAQSAPPPSEPSSQSPQPDTSKQSWQASSNVIPGPAVNSNTRLSGSFSPGRPLHPIKEQSEAAVEGGVATKPHTQVEQKPSASGNQNNQHESSPDPGPPISSGNSSSAAPQPANIPLVIKQQDLAPAQAAVWPPGQPQRYSLPPGQLSQYIPSQWPASSAMAYQPAATAQVYQWNHAQQGQQFPGAMSHPIPQQPAPSPSPQGNGKEKKWYKLFRNSNTIQATLQRPFQRSPQPQVPVQNASATENRVFTATGLGQQGLMYGQAVQTGHTQPLVQPPMQPANAQTMQNTMHHQRVSSNHSIQQSPSQQPPSRGSGRDSQSDGASISIIDVSEAEARLVMRPQLVDVANNGAAARPTQSQSPVQGGIPQIGSSPISMVPAHVQPNPTQINPPIQLNQQPQQPQRVWTQPLTQFAQQGTLPPVQQQAQGGLATQQQMQQIPGQQAAQYIPQQQQQIPRKQPGLQYQQLQQQQSFPHPSQPVIAQSLQQTFPQQQGQQFQQFQQQPRQLQTQFQPQYAQTAQPQVNSPTGLRQPIQQSPQGQQPTYQQLGYQRIQPPPQQAYPQQSSQHAPPQQPQQQQQQQQYHQIPNPQVNYQQQPQGNFQQPPPFPQQHSPPQPSPPQQSPQHPPLSQASPGSSRPYSMPPGVLGPNFKISAGVPAFGVKTQTTPSPVGANTSFSVAQHPRPAQSPPSAGTGPTVPAPDAGGPSTSTQRAGEPRRVESKWMKNPPGSYSGEDWG